jgi:hypothetical protein
VGFAKTLKLYSGPHEASTKDGVKKFLSILQTYAPFPYPLLPIPRRID